MIAAVQRLGGRRRARERAARRHPDRRRQRRLRRPLGAPLGTSSAATGCACGLALAVGYAPRDGADHHRPPVDAEEALRIGLANEIVPEGKVARARDRSSPTRSPSCRRGRSAPTRRRWSATSSRTYEGSKAASSESRARSRCSPRRDSRRSAPRLQGGPSARVAQPRPLTGIATRRAPPSRLPIAIDEKGFDREFVIGGVLYFILLVTLGHHDTLKEKEPPEVSGVHRNGRSSSRCSGSARLMPAARQPSPEAAQRPPSRRATELTARWRSMIRVKSVPAGQRPETWPQSPLQARGAEGVGDRLVAVAHEQEPWRASAIRSTMRRARDSISSCRQLLAQRRVLPRRAGVRRPPRRPRRSRPRASRGS